MISRLAIALLLGLLAQSALAAGSMLTQIHVSRLADTAELEVGFSCENRYIDHFPVARAKRIRISLRRIDRCDAGAGSTPRRELRRPMGRQLARLREVEFVSDADGGSLLLHFDEPVAITVRQGGNLNRLVVAVEVATANFDDDDGNRTTTTVATGAALTERQADRVEARAQLATTAAFGQTPVSHVGDYAINLESAPQPIDVARVDTTQFAEDAELYTTQVVIGDRTWHRLRLGFFASEQAAELVMARLKSIYVDAWVVRVELDEHALAATQVVVPPAAAAPAAIPATVAAGDAMSLDKLAALADDGRAAMMAGDNARAVKIYTRILQEPENEYTRQAQEYLGLARERSGQTAHAVAEYRRFVMLFPEGDDAKRVRQRLAGLMAVEELRPEVARVERRTRDRGRWDVYGGLAQYYRRDESKFGDRESVTGQSSVLTDFDLVARRRGDRVDASSRVTLGNLYDLLGEDQGPGNATRIYYMYADVVDSRLNTSMRIGRQSLHHSGVLGRFDGLQLSWQWRPDTRFNVVTGYPVDSPIDSVETERFFYGISTDLTSVLDLFDVSLFFNTQEVDGVDDRQAIGGELRYYDDARSLITLVDYDLSYGEINSIVLLGNWALANRMTFNAMFDTRKTPLLTTRNALIGQPFETVSELIASLGEDTVRQLAVDRTGEMQTLSAGVSTPLFDRFQVNLDVTMTNYSGTSASGDVPAIPEIDGDLYYSLNLIGSSLLAEGDMTVFGVGYIDGSNVSTWSLLVDARYPMFRGLRLNPRMRVLLRDIVRTESEQWIAAPSLRFLYRFARRFQLEFEVGGEWSSQETAGDSFDYNTYFVYGGYRADF